MFRFYFAKLLFIKEYEKCFHKKSHNIAIQVVAFNNGVFNYSLMNLNVDFEELK